MKSPFFSICVPAHNASKAIKNLLSNLSKQSFQNWELVIVDDASNDTLGEYISQQKFIPAKKIKYLFLRENHGPYYARKVAFASSTGLYVICIDADDTLIGEKALSILYKCITKHPVDILFFNATRNLISLDRYIDYCGSGLHNGYLHPSKVQDLFLSTSLFNNLWAKVIKRSVLHPVSFDKADGLKMCEDRLEMAGAILKSASFFLLDTCLYYYKNQVGSTTNSLYNYDYCKQQVFVESAIYKLYSKKERNWDKFYSQFLEIWADDVKCIARNRRALDLVRIYQIMSEDSFFKTAFSNAKIRGYRLDHKISLFFLRHHLVYFLVLWSKFLQFCISCKERFTS